MASSNAEVMLKTLDKRVAAIERALAERRFRISARHGDGARMKLVNNLLAAVNLAGAVPFLHLLGTARLRDYFLPSRSSPGSALADPADGRLRLTFEIIYGHACKPQPRAQRRGEQAVSVDDMRAMLRGGRR